MTPTMTLTSMIVLALFLFSSLQYALGSLDLGSIDEITKDFTENLNSEVEEFVSETLNNTRATLNSSNAILSNSSNLSSNQIIISNNQDVSAGSGGGSLIVNQIRNENGLCMATKVGGPGNDTLSSAGVCDDQLTGGLGADKFMCGQGSDTIRDFSPDEGDTIIDQQRCETVL
jgi:hypothetical protein